MKKAFILSASILLIFFAGFYFIQDRLIFRFEKLDEKYQFEFDQVFEEFFLTAKDGATINVLWFKSAGEHKGTVLYFHGNSGNLQRWGNYAVDLTRLGYDVVMMDYRGYGKSSGEPTELNLYQDASLLYQWARAKKQDERIIIYGRSLGSAVATKLAAEIHPELLILETPFDELRGAVPSWAHPLLSVAPLKYQFPTREFIRNVKCRMVIFHGTNDPIVPLSSALRLKPMLKEGDEFIIITDGNHRNLRSYEVYQLKLAEILK